ncbi:MAG: SIS domain-containing protein, partial [Spirochaetaceae bacterium]
MQNQIINAINQGISLKQLILTDLSFIKTIQDVIGEIVQALKADRQIFFCGNGGSAADAQHLAAELLGKYYLERKPYCCEALHTNSSYMTAVSNDYSFSEVYARLLRAKGKPGDVLAALSTSGNSGNIVRAVETANELGLITIGFTGKSGGKMRGISKYLLNVPSDDTPRIQEIHILIGHIVCECVE